MNLYSFYWDCGRMGSVEGLFLATEKEVKAAIGKEVYFGEILGKHSEIYGTLEADEITLVSDDQEKVEWLSSLFEYTCISGYNPLEYIQDSEEDELDEEE